MAGADNLPGFILGSIKAEIDVHISTPQPYLPVTMDTLEKHSAGNQVRFERHNKRHNKQHNKRHNKRHNIWVWVTPLCILLSLLLPLVTADFKPFVFKPSIWRIIYKILTVAAFIWLLLSIYGSTHSIRFGWRWAKIKAETQG